MGTLLNHYDQIFCITSFNSKGFSIRGTSSSISPKPYAAWINFTPPPYSHHNLPGCLRHRPHPLNGFSLPQDGYSLLLEPHSCQNTVCHRCTFQIHNALKRLRYNHTDSYLQLLKNILFQIGKHLFNARIQFRSLFP